MPQNADQGLQDNAVLVGSSADFRPRADALIRDVREDIGRTFDWNDVLGRGSASEAPGFAGTLENLAQKVSGVIGSDTAHKEGAAFNKFCRENKSEITAKVGEFQQLESQGEDALTTRMSGGVGAFKTEITDLLHGGKRLDERKHELGDGLKQLKDAYENAKPETKKQIDQAFENIVGARQDWQQSLAELWKAQGRVDRANEAQYLASGLNEKKAHGKAPHEGSWIKKSLSWFGRKPGEVLDRVGAVVSPTDWPQWKIQSLVKGLRADTLVRASPVERLKLYSEGVFTAKEVGNVTAEEKAEFINAIPKVDAEHARRVKSLAKFDQGQDMKPAKPEQQIAAIRDFEVKRMEQADGLFNQRKEIYQNLVLQTLTIGFHGTPVTKWLNEKGAQLADWSITMVKQAGNRVEFVYSDIQSEFIEQSLRELVGTAAAREVAAQAYKRALVEGIGKQINESAKILRGAQTMYDRMILWTARTNEFVERGVRGELSAGQDVLTRGSTRGERVQKLAPIFAERAKVIMGGDQLIKQSERVYKVDQDAVIYQIQKNVGKVPENFRNKTAMDRWMDERGILRIPFRKGFYKALDFIIRDGPKKTALGDILTAGSRRETLDTILGGEILSTNDITDLLTMEDTAESLKTKLKRRGEKKTTAINLTEDVSVTNLEDNGLLHKMFVTEANLRVAENKAKQAEIQEGKDVDAVVKAASIRSLRMAQNRHFEQEVGLMNKRKELDSFWKRSLQFAPVALVSAYLGEQGAQAFQAWAGPAAEQARLAVEQLTQQIGVTQHLLDLAHQSSSYNVQQLMPWAIQSGQSQLQGEQFQLMEQQQLTAMPLYASAAKMMMDAVATAWAGVAVALPTAQALTGTFRHKTSLSSVKPEVE